MELNSSLIKEDVEARIGTTSAKGFSLLLYKTARTDVKRLDEVYPLLWKNKYYYDDKKLLCCEISVWNKDLKEWVSRSDVGVESFTEKEKGSYSDAFKRAGFKFGIGAELYNSPFIWVAWDMEQKNNKNVPKNFYGSNLEISKYKSENGKVTELEIKYNNDVIYSLNGRVKPKQAPQSKKNEIRINYTEEASKFDNMEDLRKWYKSLTPPQQKESARVVENRKEEIDGVPF